MLSSLETEQLLLGSILRDPDVLDDIVDQVSAVQIFYSGKHRLIIKAMLDCYSSEQRRADLTDVALSLDRSGDLQKAGGRAYLAEMVEMTTGLRTKTREYLDLVLELYRKRRIHAASEQVVKMLSENGTGSTEAVQLIESALEALSDGEKVPVEAVGDVIGDFVDGIMAGSVKERLCVSSGLPDLDERIGGIYKGQVCIVGGPPSMGKTSFLINLIVDNSLAGRRILLFSLDEPKDAIYRRLLIYRSGIPSTDLRIRKLKPEQSVKLEEAAIRITQIGNIYLCDWTNISVLDIARMVRRMKRRVDIDIVAIDYIQKIRWHGDPRESRNQQIEEISDQLKIQAKDFSLAYVIASQLARRWSTLKDEQVPTKDMLRDSGALEQDANLIIFPWVPTLFLKEKHGEKSRAFQKAILALERDEKHEHPLALMVVGKNKEGPTPTVECRIDLERMKFYCEARQEIPF